MNVKPPLRMVWQHPNTVWSPLVFPEGVIVHEATDYTSCLEFSLVCLHSWGEEMWRKQGIAGHFECLADHVIGVHDASQPKRFLQIRLGDGVILRDEIVDATLGAIVGVSHWLGLHLFKDARTDEWVSGISFRSLASGSRKQWEILGGNGINPDGSTRDSEFDRMVAHAHGRVFIGTRERLLCLDLETGRELWGVPFSCMGERSKNGALPIVVGSTLVIAIARGIAVLDAASGAVKWTYHGSGGIHSVFGDVVYRSEGLLECQVVALDLKTGGILWRTVLEPWTSKRMDGNRLSTYPAISDTHLFFGDHLGGLWALDRHTGEVAWSHYRKDSVGFISANVPVIADGRLYISTTSGDPKHPSYLYCYEHDDSPKARRNLLGSAAASSPTTGATGAAASAPARLDFVIEEAQTGEMPPEEGSGGGRDAGLVAELALRAQVPETAVRAVLDALAEVAPVEAPAPEVWTVLRCRTGGTTDTAEFWLSVEAQADGKLSGETEGRLWPATPADTERLLDAVQAAFPVRGAKVKPKPKAKSKAKAREEDGVLSLYVAVLGSGVSEAGSPSETGTWTLTKWTSLDGAVEFLVKWSTEEKRGALIEKDESYRKGLVKLFASLPVPEAT